MPEKQGKRKNFLKVLCVDDEEKVLEGLNLNLRKYFRVHLATSGKQGLEILRSKGPFAIVLSDMRMPEMDGAEFLKEVHKEAPDSVRILLTGHSEMEAAIRAINEGQIFRFLTKPCTNQQLLMAFKAALKQYHLITAERVLLEQTLRGCINAMGDVLVLTNPTAFGRVTRLKQAAKELAESLNLPNSWQVEAAALFSQIGLITLPPELIDKVYYGKTLTSEQEKMVSRMPLVAEKLLSNIPRMEEVISILTLQKDKADQSKLIFSDSVLMGAQILKVITDCDTLEVQGNSAELALDILKHREGQYEPAILEAFSGLKYEAGQLNEVSEIMVKDVRIGMVFVQDVRLQTGSLFVSRGYEITEQFVERTKNFSPGFVIEPVKVKMKSILTKGKSEGF